MQHRSYLISTRKLPNFSKLTILTPIKIYTKYLYFLNKSSPKQYCLNFSIKQKYNLLFFM